MLTDPLSAPATHRSNIAYLVSRFPKLSETFVLYEFLAVRAAAEAAEHPYRVSLFALKPEREAVQHAEAAELIPEVVFRAPWHPRTWLQAGAMVITQPAKTAAAIAAVIRHNLGSFRYLITSIVAVPGALALAREMSKQGIDHLHAHFANVPTTTAYIINRVTGIPFSFTAHGSDLHRDQHMLGEKVAASSCAITVSSFNAAVMRRHTPVSEHHKIDVIYCGTDLATFYPDPVALRQRLGPARPAKVRLGCVGSLLPVKGQRYLLAALAQLKTSPIDFHCTLIGAGPERAPLVRLAKELGVQVEFTGALPRNQVAERLRTFDMVAVPSIPTQDGRKEGIPVAVMEAMASGAAVVASEVTGIPELVTHEHTGLLFPAGDATKLAEAIERLCSEPDLRRHCIESSLKRIEADFDLQTNARKVAQRFTATAAKDAVQ